MLIVIFKKLSIFIKENEQILCSISDMFCSCGYRIFHKNKQRVKRKIKENIIFYHKTIESYCKINDIYRDQIESQLNMADSVVENIINRFLEAFLKLLKENNYLKITLIETVGD